MEEVVNLDDKFSLFEDRWSPKIIGRINDMHIKVVKVEGEFVWHAHADTDELFLVRSGHLTIQLRGRPDVELGPGELFVVPLGVEHCPIAREETELLLLEPAAVVNTGEETGSSLTAEDVWI